MARSQWDLEPLLSLKVLQPLEPLWPKIKVKNLVWMVYLAKNHWRRKFAGSIVDAIMGLLEESIAQMACTIPCLQTRTRLVEVERMKQTHSSMNLAREEIRSRRRKASRLANYPQGQAMLELLPALRESKDVSLAMELETHPEHLLYQMVAASCPELKV
jgi:hypothetical protein